MATRVGANSFDYNVPILLPLIEGLGFNLTWFAISSSCKFTNRLAVSARGLIGLFLKRCSARVGLKRYLLWNDAIYGSTNYRLNFNYNVS